MLLGQWRVSNDIKIKEIFLTKKISKHTKCFLTFWFKQSLELQLKNPKNLKSKNSDVLQVLRHF